MKNIKKYIAEFIGTAVLTLVACGVAVVTGANAVATSLAFGLVIVAMAYSIGNVSGCHINPAVSLAFLIRKEISLKDFIFYVISQILGAFAGSLLLGLFLRCNFEALGGNQIQSAIMASGKVDAASLAIGFGVEVVLTFVFVIAILGCTDKRYHEGKHAPIVIGLALTLVHLLGLSFTGTSVNPARSLAPAVLQAIAGKTDSLSQVWIWIIAPLVGGALAAIIYTLITKNKEAKEEKAE